MTADLHSEPSDRRVLRIRARWDQGAHPRRAELPRLLVPLAHSGLTGRHRCTILLRHTCQMGQPSVDTPRVATVPEAATVARLLDTFNREYDTPTPGTAVLTTRLGRLLADGEVIALLTGDPAGRRRAPDPAS